MLTLLLFCAAAMAGREAGATGLGETLGGGGLAGATSEVVPGESQQAPPETQQSAPAPAGSQPDGGASGVVGGTLGTAEGVVGGAGEGAGTVVGGVADASAPVVSPATDTVGQTVVQPVAQTADPVLQPVGEATGAVLAEADPVLQPVAEAAAPVVSPVRGAVEPVVEPVTRPVSHITDPVVEAVNPDPAPRAPDPPVTGPPDEPEVPAVVNPSPTPDNGGAVGRGEPGVAASAAGRPAAERSAPAVWAGLDAREAETSGGVTAARVLADGPDGLSEAASAERFVAGTARNLAEVFALPEAGGQPAGLPLAGGLGERFLTAAVAGTYAFGVEMPLWTVGDVVPSAAALEGAGSAFGIGFILCAGLLFLFPRAGPAWLSSRVAARSAPPRPPGERPG